MSRSNGAPSWAQEKVRGGFVRRMRGVLLLVVTLSLAVIGVTACDSGGSPSADSPGPSTQDCEQITAVTPVTGAKSLVLVVDRTSSEQVEAIPPAVSAELAMAQAAGWTLTVVGINGPGAAPRMLPTIALDPAPGRQAETAVAARQIALACVAGWVKGADLTPTVTGSDQLAALASAGRQNPAKVVVISDGVSTGGGLDLRRIGFDADPAATAAALSAARDLPQLSGVRILWTGMAETVPPLPQAERLNLLRLWIAVLKASGSKAAVSTVVQAASSGPATHVNGPLDPMPSTGVRTVSVRSGGKCVTLPTGLLFGPDSAVLASTDALKSVAAELLQHPDWIAHVSGHTAAYGSPPYRQQLSKARASAAAAALRTLGVPQSVGIFSAGYGSTRPAVREWHDGVHDAAAAAKNRRVDIVYGPRDQATVDSCK